MSVTGRIHSVETCGTVDGPGIRYVVFLQGCPLRCLYCHNPDSRNFKGGKKVTVDELIEEIGKYRSFMRFSHGGVTLSGGEPCAQPRFAGEILRRCKELGVHTALDTSGYVSLDIAKPILDYVDLVLLDIKSYLPELYEKVTGAPVGPTLSFARYLCEVQKEAWVRFVLVPGLTDSDENLEELARFIAPMTNVTKVEVLPFHKMGEYKWKELGLEYLLEETPPPTEEEVRRAVEILKK